MKRNQLNYSLLMLIAAITLSLLMIRPFGFCGASCAAGPQRLVFGSAQELPSLEPANLGWVYAGRTILRHLYDPLVQYYGDPAEIQPDLAESWEKSADGIEWTFKLRTNAKFHDGTPITAEAVKFSFDRFFAIKKGFYSMFKKILDAEGVKIEDKYTVKFTLKEPYAPFLAILPYVLIVNPEQVKAHEVNNDMGSAWLKDNTAGSGSFKLKSYQPGTAYILTANKDYWGDYPVKNLDEVTWRIIRDKATKRLSILRGETHIVEELTPEGIMQLKARKGIKIFEAPEIRMFYVHMNNQHGPLKDVNLRRAIAYAFDYKGYIAGVLQGKAIQPHGPIPKGIWGGSSDLFQYKLDLDKAKQYLAKAGSAAKGLTLEYMFVNSIEVQRQLGLVLQDNLGKLGINVKLTPLTWPNMVGRMSKPETMSDMAAVYTSALYSDPDAFLYNKYHSNSWGSPPASAFYKNSQVNKLLDEARAKTDREERTKLYLEAQKLIIDESPALFISQGFRQLALMECIKDFKPVGIGNVQDFTTISIADCK